MVFAIVFILATIMAIFAVIGYMTGTRATIVTTLVVLLGLLLIARAGGSIARLINGLYFGVRFVLAGGVQALAASDRSAAISQAIEGTGPVTPLVPTDSPGVELFLLLLFVVLVTILLGRSTRLRLAGPASPGGLLLGLMNGYLLGAYLLVSLFPISAGFLPVPFGLGEALGATPAAVPAGAPGTGGFFDQAVANLRTASETTLGIIVMATIALIVIIAIVFGQRSGARSGRNGTR